MLEESAAVADGTLTDKPTPATYVVRKGDYLTRIAREYDLTIAQLTTWNQLESENVVPGQKLLLHAPAAGEVATEAPRKAAKLATAPSNEKPVAKASTRTTAEKAGAKPTSCSPATRSTISPAASR